MKLVYCLLLGCIIAPAYGEDEVDVYPSGQEAIDAMGKMIEDRDVKTFYVPETITSSNKFGQLVFDYQTVLIGEDPAPVPYIKGKFTWTGKKNSWKTTYDYRICLEYGTEAEFETKRDKLRWNFYGKHEHWEAIV